MSNDSFFRRPDHLAHVCAECAKPIVDDLTEWTDGKGSYWHGECHAICKERGER